MAFDFKDQYYPTISLRPAEMLALSKLTEDVKNDILPIFLLRPWVNSNELASATEKLVSSYIDRPFIIDIDRAATGNSLTNAGRDFEALKNPEGHYLNWRNYVSELEYGIPCVQLNGADLACVAEQVSEFAERETGYVFRFMAGSSVSGFDIFLNYLRENLSDDPFVVIIDAGWSNDPNASELFVNKYIDLLGEYGDQLTLIVAMSSFPRSFGFVDGVAAYPILSREVFSRIKRATNLPRIFYGDWASTRPTESSGPLSQPLPRIDIATKDRWISARKKKPRWDFQKSAQAITNLPEWDEIPAVWGRHFIEAVRDGEVQDVNVTGFSANAARISMHILMQSNYEADITQLSLDEPWIDTI